MRTLAFAAAVLLLAACNDSPKTQPATAPKAAEPVAAPAPVSSAADTNTATAVPSAETAAAAEASPAVLFQKCAACHGNHAEKSALNQSAVIGEWDSKRIADSIIGYQKGTYGGAMKTLMQNQVKDLSTVQVEALSEYIANLYVKTH